MALTQDETVELRLQTYQRLLEASLVAAMPIAEMPMTETPMTEMPMTETPMTEMPMTETPIARVESVYVCAMALQAAVELDAQGRIRGFFSHQWRRVCNWSRFWSRF